jgi:predicted lactoylglutathione lyase
MSVTKQQFNVYLPAQLIRQVKHRAIDDQLSLTDWMEKMLNAALGQSSEEALALSASHPQTDSSSSSLSSTMTGLSLAPLIHVTDLPRAIEFYTKLGATVVNTSRDGDYAQLRLGDAEIGLLAHPPSERDARIELTFNSAEPLTQLEARLQAAGVTIARGASDEGFGYQLQVQDSEGFVIKINQLEPDLYT